MSSPLEVQICEVLLGLQGYSASYIEETDYQGKPELQIHIQSTRKTTMP
jgi:hypothetical protein